MLLPVIELDSDQIAAPVSHPPAYNQSASYLSPISKAGGLRLPPAYSCVKPRRIDPFRRNMTALPVDRSVAKGRRGSFGFGKNAVELSVAVADNLVFLYPNSGEDSDADGEAEGRRPQATFIVSITLSIADNIPAPPPIESLSVHLRGLESLGFPQGLEQSHISYAKKKVEDACSLELEPGKAYRWEVPIEVHHDVAPYERMRFGRVFQKMKVRLEWCKQSWLSKYKDLEVERDVWICCIPRVSNMLDYARTHRTSTEHLGPMSIHMRSHHLTVGSYLRLGLYLPTPNPKSHILKMELAVLQFTTLHSRKRPGLIFQDCKPERIAFLTVEGDEFRQRMQQDSQASNWIARIPSCDRIRPSTLSGSKGAAIRLSHKLEIRIYHTFDNSSKDKPIVYSAQWPVILPSCACRWRSLSLPSYSKYDPSPVPDGVSETGEIDMTGPANRGRLRSHLDQTDCSCGIPMQNILKFEDEFEEAQHTCLTQLMTQELLAGTTPASPPSWSRQSSEIVYTAEEDGVNIVDLFDSGIDLSTCEDDETIQQQKASQQYSDGVGSSSTTS